MQQIPQTPQALTRVWAAEDADRAAFHAWLDSPEGSEWLDEEAAKDRFIRNGFHDMDAWDFAAVEEDCRHV